MDQTNAQKRTDRTASSAGKSNPGTRTTGPTTRNKNTRESGSEQPIDDPEREIMDSEEGREYLESKLLLVPVGQPLTTGLASTCLHQIAMITSSLPKPVYHAIKSLAYMLEDVESQAADKAYHDGFQVELDNFTNDIRALIADINTKVNTNTEALAEATELLTQAAKNSGNERGATEQRKTPGPDHGRQPSYSEMLTRIQPDADPKMLAKHGIRRRQIMLEGIPKESALGKMGDKEPKVDINDKLRRLAGEGGRIRAATRQRNGSILLEMDSDPGAAWARAQGNIDKLCKSIGDTTAVKKRSYNLIAKFAPLTAMPEDAKFIKEVQEVNNLQEGTISAMRWAKPIARRSNNQRFAHIILTISDANEANRILALRLFVANKKLEVDKCKREPIRCLKCQGWNHFAKECIQKDDTCGHCGQKGHRTSQCQNEETRYCTSCQSDDHTSYDRECPTFIRKLADRDRSNPENAYPFIPTDAPWTWNRTKSNNDSGPEHHWQNTQQTTNIIPQREDQRDRRQQWQDAAPGGRPLEHLTWDREPSAPP